MGQQATYNFDGIADAAPAASQGHDFKILGVNIHVPAEEKPRADSNLIGWGSTGSGVSPEDLLIGGQAARKIASGAAGGIVSGVKAAAAEASPLVKLYATQSMLEKMGVPSHWAGPLAFALLGGRSMLKGGAAEAEAAAAGPVDPNAPHLDLSKPVRPGSLTQAQIAERNAAYDKAVAAGETVPTASAARAASAAAPAAPVSPGASAPVAPTSPVAASAGTAAPQSTAAVPPAAPPTTPVSLGQAVVKLKLTAKELVEVQRLTKAGKPLQDALDLVQAQREFQAKYGLTTPTGDETKFPNGQRGGSRKLSPLSPDQE